LTRMDSSSVDCTKDLNHVLKPFGEGAGKERGECKVEEEGTLETGLGPQEGRMKRGVSGNTRGQKGLIE